jgi:hypothetical protein
MGEPTASRYELRRDDVTWRELGDEVVVLDLRTNRYLSVNASGVALWRELEKGATEQELVDRLMEAFELDAAQATSDVRAFLQLLQTKDLLAGPGPTDR